MAWNEPNVGDRYCAVCGWGPCMCPPDPFRSIGCPPTPTRDPALRKAALEALKRWDVASGSLSDGDLDNVAKAMDALREELAK